MILLNPVGIRYVFVFLNLRCFRISRVFCQVFLFSWIAPRGNLPIEILKWCNPLLVQLRKTKKLRFPRVTQQAIHFRKFYSNQSHAFLVQNSQQERCLNRLNTVQIGSHRQPSR